MKKTLSSLLLLLVICLQANAQFNPNILKKSLVKIIVTGEDKKSGVCSGFIWKQADHVVTSLHAMKPNGKVKVGYGNKFFEANILKTHPDADLVLLKVNGDIPTDVEPLKEYNDNTIKFGASIFALGYNGGAKGSSTRTLKKGFADPEVLASLVPPKDRKQLEKSGVPSINLSIIYLDGSLLPGYSGSPVVDQDGNLIGVGDGGLEQGASNVSWVIPAKYLSELEQSSTSTLPEGFVKTKQSFSAQVEVEIKTDITTEADLAAFETSYAAFDAGEFSFYQTKVRSFDAMYNSSLDPDNLDNFINGFNENNISVPYEDFEFDVYEDINNGVVVSIPQGASVNVDSDGIISVETDGPGYTFLSYMATKGDFSEMDMDEIINESISEYSGFYRESYGVNMIEDEESTYYIDVDETHKIGYVSIDSDGTFIDEYDNEYVINMYMTILLNNDQVFTSIASGFIPVDTVEDILENGGISCANYSDSESCEMLSELLQVFCASHLTTFANKKVSR